MREKVKIYIQKCRKNAVIPYYARLGDAGMDVYAAEAITLKPGETRIVPTGLKIAIPDGYEIQVRPRSGISMRTPLRLANAPGTIDSGYRDEIGVILTNTSPIDSNRAHCTLEPGEGGLGTYEIKTGDRIAQFVLAKVPEILFEETDNINEIKGDRGGGFGSTGYR